MTLAEVVVAAAIIGLIFVSFMKVTATVAKAIQYAKFRSLANVLAQEKVQSIKQLSYYKILVTPLVNNLGSAGLPDVEYDTTYFPPETVVEGGISYTRYTLIEVASEVSGVIQPMAATTPDTGMRLVTVSVVWYQGREPKRIQIRSIANNPDTPMSNSVIAGRVLNTSGVGIQGAQVTVVQNPGWSAITDAAGNYRLNVLADDYILSASMPGYFTAQVSTTIGAQVTLPNVNITLSLMSSGTVRGVAWINDHLVISRVVGSTLPVSAGFSPEYVEIYNPTTAPVTIANQVGLKFQRQVDPLKKAIDITYITAQVPPKGFYLFASTSPVHVAGAVLAADAVWNANTSPPSTNYTVFAPPSQGYFTTARPHIIAVREDDPSQEGAAALELYRLSDGAIIDQVGWRSSSLMPPFFEGAPILPQIQGLNQQEQLYRFSSTAPVLNTNWGPAYDSPLRNTGAFNGGNVGNNSVDWGVELPTLTVPPRNSLSTATLVSGTPAVGAYVTADDGLSGSTVALSAGSPRVHAPFTLTGVATGTWNVLLSSGGLMAQVSTVTVAAGLPTWIPNAGTTPSGPPAAGEYSVMLSSAATKGYVSGFVLDANGVVIGAPIPVGNGIDPAATASAASGRYFLPCSTGTWDIVANINNGSQLASYVARTSSSINVQLGQVWNGVDFRLSQGGRITGRVTRDGVNAIPGIALQAENLAGVSVDQQVTGANGIFTFVDLTTDTYTVYPVLDRGEVASPPSVSTTIFAGQTVSVGTFTITGAKGRITGRVTAGGQTIQTGVMVIASTGTLVSMYNPPVLSSNSLTGMAYYLANSREDGTFELLVRASTNPTYNLVAFYPSFATFTSTVPVLTTRTFSGAAVWPGSTTANVNFLFP